MSKPSQLATQVQEELKFHIECYAEDLMNKGVPRSEALRRAKAELGSIPASSEQCRTAWGTRFIDNLRADLRFAARMLSKSPSFTAIAIGSLALGIGANTAIFSMAKAVLLDQLNVPQPGQLRLLAWRVKGHSIVHSSWGEFHSTPDGSGSTSFTYPVFEQMRRQNHDLGDLFAFKNLGRLNVSVDGEAEVLQGDLVSGNFYQQMQVQPQQGRAISPSDDTAGATPVAVISDAYWQHRFNRSQSALGKTILVNLVPVTIVGVNPPLFTGAKGALSSPQLFLPFSVQPAVYPYQTADSLLSSGKVWWMQIMARVSPGTDEQKARAALDVAFKSAIRATAIIKPNESIPNIEVNDGSRGLNQAQGQMAKPLWSLMALSGLVLLLACANMANLLLSRSEARQREIGVRLALGAGRWRIVRQVMTESLLLAVLGGLAGLALGAFGKKAIVAMLSGPSEPLIISNGFDWGVFAFCAALSIITGLLFGAAPAWQLTRTQANTTLKDRAQTVTRRQRGLAGKFIVVFQVALSTLLVISAGFFLRTLINLNRINPGFDPHNLVLFDVRPPLKLYTGEKQIQLFRQLTDSIAAQPGVESVALTSVPPLANSYDTNDFTPEGAKLDSDSQGVNESTVGERYFETLRIPIVAGRAFALTDTETSPKVAIVNQALAKKYFPNQNPIGKTFSTTDNKQNKLVFHIVGLCADAHYASLREDPPPVFYLNYRQAPEVDWGMTYAVRTTSARAAITPALRRAIQSIDRNLPLVDVRTQQEQIDQLLSNERIFADLTVSFGVLALVLASIGIYGILAYSVSRRTNEIGIRMALGARAEQVMRMVLGEASWMTLIGIVAGLGAALASGRIIASQLYGLKAHDPATLAGAAAVLVLVALAASWLPARRAATIDPIKALRHE
ncbi:ABC transporter permease [Occallatibacter riparius]|uniref:ABC transporter permease n=1 Tax=Occallatibacter riparius TaxID=1002689 RepID=A0A9J7BJ99_9BACT|nr:ABC transporter permease [Occallatibacter riparius]UWZ82603.1 ABC transporter permease [Occallatibacter riparius]